MRVHWLVKRSRSGMFETCYLGGITDFYNGASYSHGDKLHPGGGEPLRLWPMVATTPQIVTTLRAEFPRIPMPLCFKEYADVVQNDG